MAEGKNTAAVETTATEIVVIDERTIRDKIHVVRGVQVMLNFELAEIYGYTTSAFNQQVKRNEAKFPEDFRFQLTEEEYQNLLSQNVTASWGGDRRTEPWAVQREYLFLDGQLMKADAAYISIYSQAKQSIHYVDDYLGAKTLHLLQDVQAGVDVTIFSDNK